jgi:hypothetical protein
MSPRDRLLDLLADQAVQGLDAADEAELELLLSAAPDVDAEELQRCAAALDCALAGPSAEPLPPTLRLAVERDLRRLMNAGTPPGRPGVLRLTAPRPVRRWLRPMLTASGWAAAVVIAVGAWWLIQAERGRRNDNQGPRAENRTEPKPKTAAQELASLRETPGTKTAAGTKPNAAEHVGEVVWNTERQEGFLRLTGVPVNDPSREQYQVWLFDEERGELPVDGGVFDVSGDGEVIIPIRARLTVRKPKIVAVTREKPGGVVVSKKEQIVLLARLDS